MNCIKSVLAVLFLSFTLVACAGNGVDYDIVEAKKGVFAVVVKKVDAEGKESGGMGTAFLISQNEIMTNHHVIADAKEIKITLEDSPDTYEATVVKSDPISDVAIIELEDWDKFKRENDYRVLLFADKNDLEVTEEVYTIGNPWGMLWSVSKGILSAVDRKMGASPKVLIQVDAHVYEGNSGGPLLNNDGRVIGVNSMMVANDGGSYGMALPVSMIERVMRDWSKYDEARWSQLGISVFANQIMVVAEPSAAEKAGLKVGDRITSYTTSEGTYDPLHRSIAVSMAHHDSDENVSLVIQRDGETVNIVVQPTWKTSEELVEDGIK